MSRELLLLVDALAREKNVDKDIVWGARLADILSERPDGILVLDITQFNDLVVTEPTEDFPYP